MMTVSIPDSSSSVEALALNYSRFGILVLLNNAWTLVALATAAVSFWKLKLVPSIARRRFRISSAAETQSQPVVLTRAAAAETAISPPIAASESCCGGRGDGGVVRGNRVYRLLCYDDVIVDETEEEEEMSVGVHGGKTVRFDVSERLRLSDLGFYEHQDFRVLDGTVVKLWESRASATSAVWAAVPVYSSFRSVFSPHQINLSSYSAVRPHLLRRTDLKHGYRSPTSSLDFFPPLQVC